MDQHEHWGVAELFSSDHDYSGAQRSSWQDGSDNGAGGAFTSGVLAYLPAKQEKLLQQSANEFYITLSILLARGYRIEGPFIAD